MKFFNPWDVQSKRIMSAEGISKTLYAGEGVWGGGEIYVCYGVDLYNQTITGDVTCALTASMEVAGHTGPKVIVLNDQGGSIMNVSDKPGALRAQMKHHEPVVCFEPGIAKREGGRDRFVDDKCTTIRANMGDNQPAVCYAIKNRQSPDSVMRSYKPVCVMGTSCWNAPFTNGDISPALCARAGTGGNQLPLIVLSRGNK